MVYMGSKRKYCKDIVPIIQKYINENNITTFVDCFCGGANLADKINCDTVICNDLSPTLIALHQQAQKDFSKIPTDSFRLYWDTAYADWKKIKSAMDKDEKLPKTTLPLFAIGAIEWYGSFSNGGFPRGYAKPSAGRDPYQEAYRNHQKQASEENYKKIIFMQGDYKEIRKRISLEHTLLYCDSPYKGTKPYGISPKFNFEEYYEWLLDMSKLCPIFVSEQELPEYFKQFIIWENNNVIRTVNTENNFKACEKLYLIDNRTNKE